jgi:hypothetical protein
MIMKLKKSEARAQGGCRASEKKKNIGVLGRTDSLTLLSYDTERSANKKIRGINMHTGSKVVI